MSAKHSLLTALSGVEDKGIFGLKVLPFSGKQLRLAIPTMDAFVVRKLVLNANRCFIPYVLDCVFCGTTDAVSLQWFRLKTDDG